MSTPAPTSAASRPNRHRRLKRLALVVGLLLLLVPPAWPHAVRLSSMRVFMIPSASMSPALKPGDRITVELNPPAAPRRGEVWLFEMPPAPGAGTSTSVVKRVIGLPGEVIEVRSGKILVNDRELAEPYLAKLGTYSLKRRVLGRDEYFMLGDNRDASADSHVWGPLPAELLRGRVQVRIWPPPRLGGP